MATLYDLELQESNNFIHALMHDGSAPALKLLSEQKQMAANMGPAGEEMLKQFNDDTSEMGKALKRLEQLKQDIVDVMAQNGMTSALATQANDIFAKSPESFTALSDEERKVINDYWLKKKTIILVLLQKGYSHEELFS
jgi:hypothetical protein